MKRAAPVEQELPDATVWQPYEHRVLVRGSFDTYVFSGSASNGLSVDKLGFVRGTPQQARASSVPLIIQSPSGSERAFEMPIKVNPPPVIEEAEPIRLQVGRLANRKLKATGGTAPLKWTFKGMLRLCCQMDSY